MALVLHDGVDHGMETEVLHGRMPVLDPLPVMLEGDVDALELVEFEPLLRVGGAGRIVRHGLPLGVRDERDPRRR
jgi:hypothetical protein